MVDLQRDDFEDANVRGSWWERLLAVECFVFLCLQLSMEGLPLHLDHLPSLPHSLFLPPNLQVVAIAKYLAKRCPKNTMVLTAIGMVATHLCWKKLQGSLLAVELAVVVRRKHLASPNCWVLQYNVTELCPNEGRIELLVLRVWVFHTDTPMSRENQMLNWRKHLEEGGK